MKIQKPISNTILRFIPMIFIMAVLFYVSHLPGSALRWYPKGYGLDKIFHMIGYACLAFSCYYAISPYLTRTRTIWINIGVICFCILYGVTDELHQSFIPDRVVSGWDVLAGASGSVIVVVYQSFKHQK